MGGTGSKHITPNSLSGSGGNHWYGGGQNSDPVGDGDGDNGGNDGDNPWGGQP